MIPVAAALLLSVTVSGTGVCADAEKTGRELIDLARTDPTALPDRIRSLERAIEQPLSPTDEASSEALAVTVDGRLRALCALRERPVRQGEASIERLSAILDRAEFSDARGRGSDSLAALLRRLAELWDAFLDRKEAATFAGWTRLFVLALAVAVALGGVLRFLLRRGERSRRRQQRDLLDLPTVLDAPEAHLEQARVATDPRERIRQGLLALLSALERRKWARPDRVRTNLELARELPARGAPRDLAAEVEQLVRWFDRTFYSLDPVSPDAASRFVDEVAKLERRLSSRQEAA